MISGNKDYSSKLSPWIANGSLSVRWVYYAIKHYAEKTTNEGSSEGALKLIDNLLRRDYCIYSCMVNANQMINEYGIITND